MGWIKVSGEWLQVSKEELKQFHKRFENVPETKKTAIAIIRLEEAINAKKHARGLE